MHPRPNAKGPKQANQTESVCGFKEPQSSKDAPPTGSKRCNPKSRATRAFAPQAHSLRASETPSLPSRHTQPPAHSENKSSHLHTLATPKILRPIARSNASLQSSNQNTSQSLHRSPHKAHLPPPTSK